MNSRTSTIDLPALTGTWTAFQKHVPLRPIRSGADLSRMQALADTLADIVGDDENHPLSSLFEIAMSLIEQWENEHVHIPPAPPGEVLRHLLEANDLKLKDLQDIAPEALLSEVLDGRRTIDGQLAKSLAQFFNVDIGAFT